MRRNVVTDHPAGAVLVTVFLVALFGVAVAAPAAASVVLSLTALGVAAFHYWSTEWRGPDVVVAMVDRPLVSGLRTEDLERGRMPITLIQPLVLTNAGAQPCVLTDLQVHPGDAIPHFRLDHMALQGDLATLEPTVMRPGEPHVQKLIVQMESDLDGAASAGLGLDQLLDELARHPPVIVVEDVYLSGRRTVRETHSYPMSGRWRVLPGQRGRPPDG
jgi:hypothetical protein